MRPRNALRHVCPQQAVEVDPATGIVGQMPRALPRLPLLHGRLPLSCALLQLVGSGVAGRHGEDAQSRRGAAHARRGGEMQLLPRPLARRQEKAAAAGKREIDPADYVPACVEACPTGAIRFGDLNDAVERSRARGRATPDSFRLLEKLGTEPKIYYRSKRDWVRELAERAASPPESGKENIRG